MKQSTEPIKAQSTKRSGMCSTAVKLRLEIYINQDSLLHLGLWALCTDHELISINKGSNDCRPMQTSKIDKC